MANPSITYQFSNGTSADATEVNTNFQDIIDSLTDGTKSLTMDAATFGGTVVCNGNVTLGNGTGDDITLTGSLAATLNIKTDGTFDIGSTTKGLQYLYLGDAGGNTVGIKAPAIAANYIFTLSPFSVTMPTSDGADKAISKQTHLGHCHLLAAHQSTSKTTTYTATTADKVIFVSTSGGAWTLTLYAASGNHGRTLTIIKTTADFTALTVDANASETINGNLTTSVNTQWERLVLYCDGSNWVILERKTQMKPTTVTVTGTFVTNTSYTAKLYREGKYGFLDIDVNFSGVPTTATFDCDLPSGITIDTAILPGTPSTGRTPLEGIIVFNDNSSGNRYFLRPVYKSSSDFYTYLDNASGTYTTLTALTESVPVAIAASDTLELRGIKFPVSGWKGEDE